MGTATTKSSQEIDSRFIGGLTVPDMEKIEKLAPGATERMLRLREKEQQHRFDFDSSTMQKYYDERRRGQFCAFAFAVCALMTALILGILHESTAASVIGGATIGAVVASFIGLGIRRDSRG